MKTLVGDSVEATAFGNVFGHKGVFIGSVSIKKQSFDPIQAN